jgi:uncharacterized protein
MGECLCDKCAALCCRYFALPIENPSTLKEYDDIRWYLCHEKVVVFIEEGQWYLGIQNKCKHLQPDNRCGIYEARPRICRGYSTDNCDYHGGDYDFEKLFTSAEQLWEYAQEQVCAQRRLKRQKNRKKRAAAERRGRPAVKVSLKRGGSKGGGGKRRREVVLPPALSRVAGNGQAGGNGHVGNGQDGGNGKALSLPVLRS